MVRFLATGLSNTASAPALGVHPATIKRALRRDPTLVARITALVEKDHPWAHPVDASWTQSADRTFRVRLAVEETAGVDATLGGTLEFNAAGTAWHPVTQDPRPAASPAAAASTSAPANIERPPWAS